MVLEGSLGAPRGSRTCPGAFRSVGTQNFTNFRNFRLFLRRHLGSKIFPKLAKKSMRNQYRFFMLLRNRFPSIFGRFGVGLGRFLGKDLESAESVKNAFSLKENGIFECSGPLKKRKRSTGM